ncbi:MAG: hypothetical protein GF311_11480 [Candidatus Lokiarchaeota archaeon]|nr:hypothetical protein [Candidatus Lokiarchaeota archaeon]
MNTNILERLYLGIKPIGHTFIFELKKQWKKFVAFSIITVGLIFLASWLPYALFPGNSLPAIQTEFFRINQNFLSLILIFANCFFFSGIICSEYDKETGFILFPKINKYKLIVGKYIGSYVFVMGITGVFYFTLGMLGLFYYGGPLDIRLFHSFGIALLYILAVSSFITFFSSFMKKENMTIVTTILILLIGFNVISQFVVLANPDIEPLYSLQYAGNLMSSILYLDFPESVAERYTQIEVRNFTFRTWNTPTIIAGVSIMLVYTFLSLLLAAIIFKRRQL